MNRWPYRRSLDLHSQVSVFTGEHFYNFFSLVFIKNKIDLLHKNNWKFYKIVALRKFRVFQADSWFVFLLPRLPKIFNPIPWLPPRSTHFIISLLKSFNFCKIFQFLRMIPRQKPPKQTFQLMCILWNISNTLRINYQQLCVSQLNYCGVYRTISELIFSICFPVSHAVACRQLYLWKFVFSFLE